MDGHSPGADRLGVDAVVYPGLLSDISLNDGGGGKASFGRRDTPGAANGIPTVVFPAGYNDHGQPINLQLLGRAWDDGKLVGMAYAFEHFAEAAGKGHVTASTVPALSFEESKDDDHDKDDRDDRDDERQGGRDHEGHRGR